MSPDMRALVDAPLADSCKINPPSGKPPAPRRAKLEYSDKIKAPKVSRRELAERKEKAAKLKLTALLDYYAGTALEADRVAQHLGIYRQEKTGEDDKGKPIFSRVLDVERVAAELSWRRNAA